MCQLPFVLQRQCQSLLAFLPVLRCSWELRKSQVAKQPPKEEDECVCSALVSWGEVWPSGTSTLIARFLLSGLERNAPVPTSSIRMGKYRPFPKIWIHLSNRWAMLSNTLNGFVWAFWILRCLAISIQDQTNFLEPQACVFSHIQ